MTSTRPTLNIFPNIPRTSSLPRTYVVCMSIHIHYYE